MLINPPVEYTIDGVQTRTVTNMSGAKFIDATGERIDILVGFAEFQGEMMPMTVYKYDSVAYCRELYNDLISGKYGNIAEFVAE